MSALTVAYFVTSHGFGHAARSAAVMEALGRRDRRIGFEIFTTVPPWFFSQSLSVQHTIRQVESDVGLVQIDPVREDLPATVAKLEVFWAQLDDQVRMLVGGWGSNPPPLVVSDISPLGLAVAARLGMPSVLIENFTWEWIYDAYREETPDLLPFGESYAELAAKADFHIQCEPACQPVSAAEHVRPISRRRQANKQETRRGLGLRDDDQRPLVLLTMGGMGWGGRAARLVSRCVVVTLGGVEQLSHEEDVIRLPDRSPVYPPDLISTADAVIGKLGYSTVAECYGAGTRFGYVCRPSFPESPVLEEFVCRNLPSLRFGQGDLEAGNWTQRISRLLSLPRAAEQPLDGAEDVADLLHGLLQPRA
jgi:hypothetical protein